MRHVFPLRFPSNPGSDGPGDRRIPRVGWDRDAWALHHLTRLVSSPGDREEGLFNVLGAKNLDEKSVKDLMRSGDLILTTTRLPLNDDDKEKRTKKRVDASGTWLERKIFEGARKFLQWCNRRSVVLTEEGAAALAPAYADRARIEFQPGAGEALYKKLGVQLDRNPPHAATAGYIIYTKELWPDGPGCLSLFGMSGPITFGFASAVREIFESDNLKRLALEESELIFVEITLRTDTPPAERPRSLIPEDVEGHPTYWRKWHLQWNRRRTCADIPAYTPT